MNVAEVARLAGVAPSAVRWYEEVGRPAARRGAVRTGTATTREDDSRGCGSSSASGTSVWSPPQAGRLARIYLDHGEVDPELVPVLASQRAAIARRRADLDRLEGELLDVEATLAAGERVRLAKARNRTSLRHGRSGVLFVCTGNSGRSQIAEALLTATGRRARSRSGPPARMPRPVSPYAVAVLAERRHRLAASPIEVDRPVPGQHFDYVITVCDRARETCPVFPGSENTLHWGLDDPAEVARNRLRSKRAAYRRTRDELSLRLRPFVEIARAPRRPRTTRLSAVGTKSPLDLQAT